MKSPHWPAEWKSPIPRPLGIIDYESCVIASGNKIVDEEIMRLARRINELLDERVKLERDAERYRYLRMNCDGEAIGTDDREESALALDRECDAAIAGRGPR